MNWPMSCRGHPVGGMMNPSLQRDTRDQQQWCEAEGAPPFATGIAAGRFSRRGSQHVAAGAVRRVSRGWSTSEPVDGTARRHVMTRSSSRLQLSPSNQIRVRPWRSRKPSSRRSNDQPAYALLAYSELKNSDASTSTSKPSTSPARSEQDCRVLALSPVISHSLSPARSPAHGSASSRVRSVNPQRQFPNTGNAAATGEGPHTPGPTGPTPEFRAYG